MQNPVKRGDIYYADLSPVVGSEQGRHEAGAHSPERHGQPAQPDGDRRGNNLADGEGRLPTHTELSARNYGLSRDSVILLEQIRTLDKSRLRERMGQLDGPTMDRVNSAIAVSFGLAQ